MKAPSIPVGPEKATKEPPEAYVRSEIAKFLRSKHYLDSEEMKDAVFGFIVDPRNVPIVCANVVARFSEEIRRDLLRQEDHGSYEEHFLPEYKAVIQAESYPLNRRVWLLVVELALEYITPRELELIHSKVLDKVYKVDPKGG
jgi:hypothetical protein